MICRNLFLIYILLFINICKIYSKEIKAIIYSYGGDEDITFHRQIEVGFNEYVKKNNLDIQLKYDVLTPFTSTMEIGNYGDVIQSYLQKGSDKYDIYFFYGAYTRKYAKHFENLRKYLPDEVIKPYDESLLKETCSSNDNELVAMPIYLSVSALYSNIDLLKKYNKLPPKTWDELMKTSKYIVDEEKKKGNTKLKRYNGCLNEYNGSIPIYEFINSYRDSNDAPHPELTDINTISALEKLKEMKNEIGEDIFKASDEAVLFSVFLPNFESEFVFARYFYGPHNVNYTATALPGKKEGVSGSIVIPNSFAINKYISEERKQLAAKFLEYVSLRDVQREYIIGNGYLSGILDLYNEQGVCRDVFVRTNVTEIDCEIIRGSQPFSFLKNDNNLFADDDYHRKYRSYMDEFIYGNKPVNEVLKKIYDITPSYGVNRSNISFFLTITFMLCWLLF